MSDVPKWCKDCDVFKTEGQFKCVKRPYFGLYDLQAYCNLGFERGKKAEQERILAGLKKLCERCTAEEFANIENCPEYPTHCIIEEIEKLIKNSEVKG